MAMSRLEIQARYRAKNRERLREENRIYAARKRREAGIPALGSPESTENRRNARKLSGSDHPNWKGDEAGYIALHKWVALHKERSGVCKQCGRTPVLSDNGWRSVATEWANISGEYRRDLDDFEELCVSCHRRRDMTDQKRAKIGAASRGRVVSAETREKLRVATTRRWAQSRGA